MKSRFVQLLLVLSLSWLGLGVFLFGFLFASQYLYVNDGIPPQTQALMALSGGEEDRMQKTIELYHHFPIRWVLLSGGPMNAQETWGQRLLHQAQTGGIPKAVCVVEDRAHSTYTNFEFMMPVIEKLRLTDVVVVTSWYHTRRTRWVADRFERRYPVHFYVVSAQGLPYPISAMIREGHVNLVLNEWFKLAWYQLRHA